MTNMKSTIITDHKALTYIHTTSDPHGKLFRYMENILLFDVDIIHRSEEELAYGSGRSCENGLLSAVIPHPQAYD